MSLIVVVATAACIGASVVLRWGGVDAFALRFPLSVLFGYVAFLVGVWSWRTLYRRDRETLDFDVPHMHRPASDHAPSARFGGGGGFSGGGSGGSWGAEPTDSPVPVSANAPHVIASPASDALSDGTAHGVVEAASNVSSGASLADGADRDALPILLVVAVVALVAGSVAAGGWIIYTAPDLFAEVVADTILCTAIARGVPAERGRGWLAVTLRRTWWIAVASAALAWFAGSSVQTVAPQAHTLREALEAGRSR
ncbi:MAG: hypothetical protein HY275_18290 [Gemmatimonadetes bacterium]|nr:hypothetical protein [Gemmatimonadota bacterium]